MSNTPKFAIYLSIVLLIGNVSISSAVVKAPQTSPVAAEELVQGASKKERKKQYKSVKRAIKANQSGVIKNKKFQIGLIAFGIGFGFSLLGLLTAGAAIIGFIGVLGIVIGLVFMVWGLLEFIA